MRASPVMKPSMVVNRLAWITAGIDEQNAKTRVLIALSLEALRLPAVDTFLGRKTQEPFPRESQD
jgi:hypothetical protein